MDLNYIKKKPTSFNNFLNYWKWMTLFNPAKQFKLALVLQNPEKVGHMQQTQDERGYTEVSNMSLANMNQNNNSVMQDRRG